MSRAVRRSWSEYLEYLLDDYYCPIYFHDRFFIQLMNSSDHESLSVRDVAYLCHKWDDKHPDEEMLEADRRFGMEPMLSESDLDGPPVKLLIREILLNEQRGEAFFANEEAENGFIELLSQQGMKIQKMCLRNVDLRFVSKLHRVGTIQSLSLISDRASEEDPEEIPMYTMNLAKMNLTKLMLDGKTSHCNFQALLQAFREGVWSTLQALNIKLVEITGGTRSEVKQDSEDAVINAIAHSGTMKKNLKRLHLRCSGGVSAQSLSKLGNQFESLEELHIGAYGCSLPDIREAFHGNTKILDLQVRKYRRDSWVREYNRRNLLFSQLDNTLAKGALWPRYIWKLLQGLNKGEPEMSVAFKFICNNKEELIRRACGGPQDGGLKRRKPAAKRKLPKRACKNPPNPTRRNSDRCKRS